MASASPPAPAMATIGEGLQLGEEPPKGGLGLAPTTPGSAAAGVTAAAAAAAATAAAVRARAEAKAGADLELERDRALAEWERWRAVEEANFAKRLREKVHTYVAYGECCQEKVHT